MQFFWFHLWTAVWVMTIAVRGSPTPTAGTTAAQTWTTTIADISTILTSSHVQQLNKTVEDNTITPTDNQITEATYISKFISTRSPKSNSSPALLSVQRQTNAPKQKCGQRSTRSARIVGGSDSSMTEFPWAVSVRLVTNHYCGGTIINRFWVLTAAHCVKRYNARYFRVRPGGRNVHVDESHTDWDIHVAEVAIHPDFGQPRRYSNDVALMRLNRPIPYSDLAQPICLPKSTDEDYEGRNATVVGWGWLNEVEKGKSKRLQKVEVPVLNNTICAKWYSEEYNGYVQIQDYQICAGYKEGGKDSCQGDSGGPLVMLDADHYTLIGVVSAGVGCGRRHLPGIYSRISVFVPWIIQVSGGLQ